MIAREGLKIVIPAFVTAFLFTILTIFFPLIWSLKIICWISLIFFLFSLYFFRDPERKMTQQENIILSPADGRVVAIEEIDDDYVGKAKVVSIFMSIFNVHVNRIPYSGKIEKTEYSEGKFLAAYNPITTFENENNKLYINCGDIKITVKQIAGAIARRIISYFSVGDQVKIGDRFGIIMFGSRVDIVLPTEIDLKVILKQKVTGAKTIIGVINEKKN